MGIKLILDQWTHTAPLDLKWAEPVTPYSLILLLEQQDPQLTN